MKFGNSGTAYSIDFKRYNKPNRQILHEKDDYPYFEATRAYVEHHGKPAALYSDKASVFRSPTAGKTGRSATHFGRAMYELTRSAPTAALPRAAWSGRT